VGAKAELAEKIQCPIHIINVSNDKIMHLKHQEDLKTFYPKAQIITLKQEDIGHFGIYTRHQVFTASLKSFLEQYEPRSRALMKQDEKLVSL
jgi:predicted alpha/beta hydrolase